MTHGIGVLKSRNVTTKSFSAELDACKDNANPTRFKGYALVLCCWPLLLYIVTEYSVTGAVNYVVAMKQQESHIELFRL